ncbi:MAG TPA: Hsp20/alpha crystallin family protein [Verrucomicrobiae bacterium]|nr:Hsp20/alpha crystallin family protein [Verrucomicrobiae bacterium]
MNTTVENQTANNHLTRDEYVAPNVDIFETTDGYVLQAEMPGVGKDGVEITLEENEITITGRRTPETVDGEALFRERHNADYRRVFELDPAIDTAKIAAKVEQGLLTVTLPKSERVKPRKISVD